MKFNLLIEELLIEVSNPEDIYKKYYSDIPWEHFTRVISYDPGTKVEGGKLTKIGKYGKILLNMFRNKKLRWEDMDKAREYLGYVYKYNIPVDHSKIQDLPSLYEIIKKYVVLENPDLNTVFEILPKDEYKVLHNGKKWIVMTPTTERAACYLGVSSQWCTTWGPYSLEKRNTDRENYFNKYNKQGPLYIIINKENHEEKYQFHFQSKQYMNSSDNQIKTAEFINENEELKYFFFPSFIRQVTKEQMDSEMEKVSILSPEDSMILLKRSVGSDADDNPIALAILNNDEEVINQLITCNDFGDQIEFEKGNIQFNFKRLRDDLGSVENVLSYYNGEIQGSFEHIVSDMGDMDENRWSDELEPAFTKYYEENNSNLKEKLSILNFETFKIQHFEGFFNEENIREKYIGEVANMSSDNYDAEAQKQINEIERYITINQNYNRYEVYVTSLYFIQFIIKHEIVRIDKIFDVFDDFINEYNIQTEYEGIYDYDREYPEYNVNVGFTSVVDDYFEKIYDAAEKGHDCAEYRRTLNDVVHRIFKDSTYYENEHVILIIQNLGIDCENGTVSVKYTNKDTLKKYEGNVKVDNLASYALNYKLFESYISFRKNIIL